MSTLKSNNIQIGQSATATQNFVLSVPSSPDGTIKLARGNQGATTADVLSVDASGNVSMPGTLSATLTAASIPNNSVTAAKLGTNEQKQIAKAWVNFFGSMTSNTGFSYTRSGTTVTVSTPSGSGLTVGNTVVISSATDSAINGSVIVTAVTGTSFSFTTSATGANGTLTYTLTIRSSYNVSSITKNGTGDYTVNFTTPMADANYAAMTSSIIVAGTNGAWNGGVLLLASPTTTSVRVGSVSISTDFSVANVAIFGN